MANEEKFTDKQRLFCLEYLKDLNGSKAAARAGYSEGSAKEIAYGLLQLQHIQDEIVRLNAERMEKVKADGEFVIQEFLSIAKDDIPRYVTITTTKTGKLKFKWKDLSTIDTRNISEISYDKAGGFKFKRYPRDNALTQLGRHFQVFEDKVTIKTNLEKILSEYSESGILNDAGIERLAELILAHHKKMNNGQ